MSEDPGFPTGPRIDDIRRYRASFVGVAVLACVPFVIWASLGEYGVATAVVLTVVWLLLLALAIGAFMRRPRLVPVLGVAGWVAWILAVWVSR